MKKENPNPNRRQFIKKTGTIATGTLLASTLPNMIMCAPPEKKMKVAMVGTGTRGINMWGKAVVKEYPDFVEFVGICDLNPGRLAYAKGYMELECPTFTDFEKMMTETKPDTLIVTTIDNTHHEFIVKGMEMGANIITEKPMTTDEEKCQAIIDAERKTGKKVTVTFNYRYSPHRQKIYELLRAGTIGDIVSVDFHWYLDVYHGAAYFRRWHGLREKGGTLLVHKATHHFDLLNWWLESEPQEVFGYGDLVHYGKNNDFRHTNCRPCPHKENCKFYWKMDDYNQKLYGDHEEHDGYLRDRCVWGEHIDIYDKMAVQIKYANNTLVSYSLTTQSPYEGYRIAFNGMNGRIEAWIKERQPWDAENYDEIRITTNFGKTELIQIPHGGGGHGGGDTRLKDKIFKSPNIEDPLRQSAGTRDGAMSILVGIAARNSIESGKPVKIGDLTSLKPMAVRP